jgi:hypothetical protein
VAPRKPTGASDDDEIHEPGQPDPVTPVEQVAHPDDPSPMPEGEITTMESLMGQREIEVDPVEEPRQVMTADPNQMVVIRMNETLEDFTYGDPNMHYKLEAGKRYRLPVHIARYLNGLGYVWH